MFGAILNAIGWAFLPALLLPMLCLIVPSRRLRSASIALSRTIDAAIGTIGRVVKWSLPMLALSVAASVFMLSVFGVGNVKLLESAVYFQAVIVLLGCAATLLAGEHVRVDVFFQNMTDVSKARVDVLGFYVLLVPVCILILWNSQGFVSFAWAAREGSTEADGIRGVFLLKTLLPVFAVTMIAQGLAIAIRAALVVGASGDRDRVRSGSSP